MSTPIEADKKAYYLTLEKTQQGGMDITGWLKWFLGCMDRALQGAANSLAVVLRKSVTWERINGHFRVNDRQRAVVNQMLDGPTLIIIRTEHSPVERRAGGRAAPSCNR